MRQATVHLPGASLAVFLFKSTHYNCHFLTKKHIFGILLKIDALFIHPGGGVGRLSVDSGHYSQMLTGGTLGLHRFPPIFKLF